MLSMKPKLMCMNRIPNLLTEINNCPPRNGQYENWIIACIFLIYLDKC